MSQWPCQRDWRSQPLRTSAESRGGFERL
jgi:hypothetical protein